VGTPALPRRDAAGPCQIIRATNCSAGFQKPSKPSKSAAIRTHNYDGVARAAGEFADTGQGSMREFNLAAFGCEALVEIAATLMAAYRTDEKKSADTALLIGVLSVALRRHVSKVPRAVDPAWRDVRTITDVKWLLRSSG
jgi:hypothetical protein